MKAKQASELGNLQMLVAEQQRTNELLEQLLAAIRATQQS